MSEEKYDFQAVEELLGDGEECFALMVASSPHTPLDVVGEILVLMPFLLEDFAYDESARPEILELLSHHANQHVRHAVAGNPSTPTEALDLLCVDASTAVRFNLAGNRSTSTSALDFLCEDTNAFVAGEARINRDARF